MIKVPFAFALIVFIGGVCINSSIADEQETITFESLLNEMADHTAVARWPKPAYTCKQSSSYDRNSTDPNDKEGWFANHDFSSFLRSEVHDGRTEWVLTDVKGPGAIVRFWHAAANEGNLRFYLDDSSEPVIVGNVEKLIGGFDVFKPPFAQCIVQGAPGAGKTLYLPIPYAKRCVITYDGPNFRETKDFANGLFWNINYRTYEPETKVETFSMEQFEAAKDNLEKTGKTLVDPPTKLEGRAVSINRQIKPGGSTSLPLEPGPVAVRTIEMKIEAENIEQALRSTVLQMRFDGEETVWCPVGEFFGGGVGVNPFNSWYRTVKNDGTMICRWVMPYKESADLALTNYSKETVNVQLKVVFDKWNWDERSMYFHTTWHYQPLFKTNDPHFDWNFIKIKGKGVMVGDTLALMNTQTLWWGEGDEKIYIDGETFPSHFGTGSEDYYGYAYGQPHTFSKPFHAQPRVGLFAHMGHRTNTRSRSLDAIPFTKSLQFDIERWGTGAIELAYAGTTYWYSRGDATSNYGPAPGLAAKPIPSPYPGIHGALEAEKMPLRQTAGQTGVQQAVGGGFSGDRFWWTEGKAGDTIMFQIDVSTDGKYIDLARDGANEYDVMVNLAKTPESGIVEIYFGNDHTYFENDKAAGNAVDLHRENVAATGEFSVGQCKKGPSLLIVKFVGANDKAKEPYKFGLDYIRLERIKR